nr:MAG: matrixin [Candidatus Nanosalinarum sp. J07AB56]
MDYDELGQKLDSIQGKISNRVGSALSNLNQNPNQARKNLDNALESEEEFLNIVGEMDEELLSGLSLDKGEIADVTNFIDNILEKYKDSIFYIAERFSTVQRLRNNLYTCLREIETNDVRIDLVGFGAWQKSIENAEKIAKILREDEDYWTKPPESYEQEKSELVEYIKNNDLEQCRLALEELDTALEALQQDEEKAEVIEEKLKNQDLLKESRKIDRALTETISDKERLEYLIERLSWLKQQQEERKNDLRKWRKRKDGRTVKKTFSKFEDERNDIEQALEEIEGLAENGHVKKSESLEKGVESMRSLVKTLEKRFKMRYFFFQEPIEKGLSRRDFTKAAAIFLGSQGLDATLNVLKQAKADQLEFMEPLEPHEPTVKSILDGEKPKIHIINIWFGDSEPVYRGEENKLMGRIKKGLQSLEGVDRENSPKIKWHNVNPRQDFSVGKEENQQEISRDVRKLVKQSGLDELREGEIIIKPQKILEGNQGYTDVNLYEYLGQYWSDPIIGNGQLKVLVADFQVGLDNPVSGQARGGSSKDDGYSLLDYSFTYKPDNRNKFVNTTVHEIGHQLGLPHAASTVDVMSYAATSDALGTFTGVPFGPESNITWRKVKKQMT